MSLIADFVARATSGIGPLRRCCPSLLEHDLSGPPGAAPVEWHYSRRLCTAEKNARWKHGYRKRKARLQLEVLWVPDVTLHAQRECVEVCLSSRRVELKCRVPADSYKENWYSSNVGCVWERLGFKCEVDRGLLWGKKCFVRTQVCSAVRSGVPLVAVQARNTHFTTGLAKRGHGPCADVRREYASAEDTRNGVVPVRRCFHSLLVSLPRLLFMEHFKCTNLLHKSSLTDSNLSPFLLLP